jgi:hypothetical protein
MAIEQARPLVGHRSRKAVSKPHSRPQLTECEHGRVLCPECDAAEIASALQIESVLVARAS